MAAERALCETFVAAHPQDAARMLERWPTAEVASLLHTLQPDVIAGVVGRMIPTLGAECLVHLNTEVANQVLEHLPVDVAAAMLRRLEPTSRDALLESLGTGARHLRTLLTYREGTAGSMMDPGVLVLPDDVTVGEALLRTRRAARHLTYYLYVVDRSRKLVGVLDIAALMRARPGERLALTMRHPVIAIAASAGPATILAHPGWSEFHDLPVVDAQWLLLGVIRYQTFRHLETQQTDRAPGLMPAVIALGELYWLGVSGVLGGLAGTVAPRSEARDGDEEIRDGA